MGEAALVPTAEVVPGSTLLVTGAASRVAPNFALAVAALLLGAVRGLCRLALVLSLPSGSGVRSARGERAPATASFGRMRCSRRATAYDAVGRIVSKMRGDGPRGSSFAYSGNCPADLEDLLEEPRSAKD